MRGVAALLTLGIWAFTFLLFLAPQIVATGRISSFSVGLVTAEVIFGIAMSLALYNLAVRTRDRKNWARVFIVGAGACFAALLLSLFDAWFGGLILKLFLGADRVPEDVISMAVSNFISFSWLYGMLGSLYVILQSNAALRERDLQLAEADAALQSAQLNALRLQLNPHFLFNTLNAISSLISTGRNDQGEAMLTKLCDFLRTALTENADSAISLGEELETLQNYLEIEEVRFGDRLIVEFDCPESALDVLVPGFILQPLVENAIKYAVAPTSGEVTIRVSAEISNDRLLLSVADKGGGGGTPIRSGTGLGLANVRRRLHVLYGPDALLDAAPNPEGYTAIINLPLSSRTYLGRVA